MLVWGSVLLRKKHLSGSHKQAEKIFPGGKTMNVKTLLETKGKDVVSIDAGNSVEDAIRVMSSRKIKKEICNQPAQPSSSKATAQEKMNPASTSKTRKKAATR